MLTRLRAGLFPLLALLVAGLGLTLQAENIPPGCKGNGLGISLFVDKGTARVGDTLNYSLLISNQEFPACRATDIESVIVTPDGAEHSITLRRTTLNPGESDFYENVVSYVVRAQDIQQPGGNVNCYSLTIAVINQSSDETSQNRRDVNTVIVTPCLSIEATCEGGVGENAPIAFAGTVRNCGETTLEDVTVVNTTTGDQVFGPATLEPGQSADFSGAYQPTEPCSGTAVLLAEGTDALPPARKVSASTSVTCANTTTPGIEVTAECPSVPPQAGDVLTYTGAVRNTGDVTLKNVLVVSDQPESGTVVLSLDSLAPGETANFSGSFPTPADACSVASSLTASGLSACSGERASHAITTVCPLAAQGKMALSVNCPANPVQAGGTAVYTGVVSNPGTVTLSDIQVFSTADPEVPIFTLASLAPGAQAAFSAEMPVPAGACSVTAGFTATATDRCDNSGITATDSATCPVITHPALAVTHGCPSSLAPGSSASLPGTVKNTGDITLTEVQVFNGETVVFGPVTLEPGQTASFEAPISVPLDTCSLTTTLTARGADECSGAEVTSTSTQVCPVATSPDFVLTKECPDSPAPGGGTITYRGSLANTGNVTLLNLAVADQGSLVIAVPSLAPGEVTNFTFTTAVPPNVCEVTDTWTATGSGQCDSEPITRTATTTCSVVGSPDLTLSIQCAGPVTAGETATYSGVVANTGDVTLKDVVVTSAATEEPVYSIAQLPPGASATFAATVPVPLDLCELTTMFMASASGSCGGQGATDSASASCPVISAPALAVTHDCPAEPGVPGAPTSFHGRVTNTGNITLTNVVVVHNLSGEPVFGPAKLAPGQSADFVGNYVVPEDQIGCAYPSQVTATGNDMCSGTPVRAENQIQCPIRTIPGIEVELSCGAPVPQGAVMAYTGVVRNTGNVQLNQVTLRSSNTGEQIVAYWEALPAGAEVPFGLNPKLGIYVTNNCCSVTHTVTVTAVDNCSGEKVKDTATKTCPVLFNPQLTITVLPPAEVLEPGDTLRYTGTVINVGDVTLVDVYVRNFIKDKAMEVVGPLTLMPGQTVNYTHSFVVPEGFCGNMKLTATGRPLCDQSSDSSEVTASASAKCQVITTPGIFVVKNCPSTPISSEGAFTYTGTVINVGNAPLKDVMVYSDNPTPNTPVFGPVDLDAGESKDFTASYTLSTECCQSVDMLVAKGVDVCSGVQVSNTGASACPVRYSPAIQVTKTCVSPYDFTGTVENVGDITLLDVTVRSGETLLLGPIELAPGEVKSFASGSPTAPPSEEGEAGYDPTDTPVVAEGTSLCGDYVVKDSAVCKTVGTSSLAILGIAPTADGFLIRWAAKPGLRYRVECTDTLDGEWRPVGGDVQATGNTAELSDNEPGAGARFYRVRQLAE